MKHKEQAQKTFSERLNNGDLLISILQRKFIEQVARFIAERNNAASSFTGPPEHRNFP